VSLALIDGSFVEQLLPAIKSFESYLLKESGNDKSFEYVSFERIGIIH